MSRASHVAEGMGNPAAAADAEQHARQEIAGLGARLATRVRAGLRAVRTQAGARPLAAGAVVSGAVVSGWLIARRRRRR